MKQRSERGSALLLAVLVSAAVVLLGLSLLLAVGTEHGIAGNERYAEQALAAAESGARLVRAWFDDPGATDLPVALPVAEFDRSLRRIDHDDDPATPARSQDGAGWPRYKQGIDRDGNGLDDLFDRPYRGSLADAPCGTEAGPDARLDGATSSSAASFLERASRRLFAGFPDRGAGIETRLTRIDVYGPPTAPGSTGRVRLGIATVTVAAGVFKREGPSERVLAERTVTIVLGEIPYAAADGPVLSCGAVAWPGPLSVRWGPVRVLGSARLSAAHAELASSWPRSAPDRLWGWDDDTAFAAYRSWLEGSGERIEDPWLSVQVAGTLAGAPPAAQPYPFTWDPLAGAQPGAGERPNHDDPTRDGDHSNLFQGVAGPDCSAFDYTLWKSIARSGRRDTRYWVWDTGTRFREDGHGPSLEFRTITDGAQGLYFFDTADALPPKDADGDGLADNLTPDLALRGGSWGFRGLLYLNAASFDARSVRGRPVTLRAPGEPWQDRDADGRYDAGEPWLNLRYPTFLGGPFLADALDNLQDDGALRGVAVRNAHGPAIPAEAVVGGVLVNTGTIAADGDALYHGALVARSGFLASPGSVSAPVVHHDAALGRGWPPRSWRVPRVRITRWECAR